jgi:cell division septation protein DedD
VNYQFELKSSQLYMIFGGMVAIGLLLFLIGIIIGAGSAAAGPESAEDARKEEVAGPVSADNEQSNENVPDTGRSIDEPEARSGGLPLPADSGSQPRIYEIQLSAHLDRDATQSVIEDLSANNHQPYVVETGDSRDRTLYTVRIGPWDSMAEAAEAARTFRRYPGLDAYEPVIRHRPRPLASNDSAGE